MIDLNQNQSVISPSIAIPIIINYISLMLCKSFHERFITEVHW